MKEAIYIAGPMRGKPESNFPAFNAATDRFRRVGWFVYSPVEIGEMVHKNDPAVPGGAYLRADLRAIAECSAIALLPDWQNSTGARCEVAAAITIGLSFYDAETMAPIPPPARVTINGGYEKSAGRVDLLDDLRSEVIDWANSTFTVANPHSKAEHLRREAEELCRDPHDVEEMADVFILLSHISDGHDLHSAVRAKLEKNKARKWGSPDAQGVVEHIR